MAQEILFYCIKVINKDGTRGYVIEKEFGITISKGLHPDITQFETEKDAKKFIRDRRLERGGVTAHVRTNLDIIEEEQKLGTNTISTTNKPLYHLENHNGEKCFYESKREVYFFKKVEAGYPIWIDEKSAILFIKAMKFEQALIFIVKSEKTVRVKKLIQAYGQTKNDKGELSEPKYFDMEDTEYEPC